MDSKDLPQFFCMDTKGPCLVLPPDDPRLSAGETPEQLTRTVERLLRRCGHHADLAIDYALMEQDVFHHLTGFLDTVGLQQSLLCDQVFEVPLGLARQEHLAECSCSPFGRLGLQTMMMSGSRMEGLVNNKSDDIPSDTDLMHEYGPVRWTMTGEETVRYAVPFSPKGSSHAPVPVPELTIVSTKNPGFVLVKQARKQTCPHQKPLTLSAEKFRIIMKYRVLCMLPVGIPRPAEVSGPAIMGSIPAHASLRSGRLKNAEDTDFVPCLHVPSWWPAEEFFERARSRDWPPASAREDMRRFGVHLVPTGCPGSVTEKLEWRVPFSRSEVVTSWHLPQELRLALCALKACKRSLELPCKGLKSYYMKTALFWLCQESTRDHWPSVTSAARNILDRLEVAVIDGNLSCFFWTGINLLRRVTAAELLDIRRTICLIRQNMTPLMMRWCVKGQMPLLRLLPADPDGPLSPEHKLRISLARALILRGLKMTLKQEPAYRVLSRELISILVRSSATAELRQLNRSVGYSPQMSLFWAMMVAPRDVAAKARLVPRDGGGFFWDAGPLLALLTSGDLAYLRGGAARISGSDAPLRSREVTQLVALWLLDSSAERRIQNQMAQQPLDEDADEIVPYFEWTIGINRKFEAARRRALLTAPYLESHLMVKCELSLAEAHRLAMKVREGILRVSADPRTPVEYSRLLTSVPDPWQLRPFVPIGSE